MNNPFQGSIVALPTPFLRGELDLPRLVDLIDFQAENGTAGVVVAGTTGEAPTLTDFERRSAIHAAVDAARGRLQVIAGVGTNATARTIEQTRFATATGVDGVLVVTPYYNKPGRRGLIAHYRAVADSTSLPLILYNVPARTGVDLTADAVAELHAQCENVVAIKECTGVERARDLRRLCDIAVLCGEDRRLADFIASGAVGAVNVVGNVAPRKVVELIEAAAPGGNRRIAAECLAYLTPIVRDLFLETNPVPVKHALARMGLCEAEVRLPLVGLEPRSVDQIESTLVAAALVATGA